MTFLEELRGDGFRETWLVSPIHNDEAGPVSQRTVE